MVNNRIAQRVGEVMVSHTQRIEAQCYRLHAAPPLGALLRVGEPPTYAVVREIWHEPLDPTRPLAPRGEALESEEEIYAANPQLSAMLTTRFAAVVVGYGNGMDLRPGLPDQPPGLHSFVFLCDRDELASFASDLRWLRLMLSDRTPAGDAALALFLRRAADSVDDRRGFLKQAGKAVVAELFSEPLRMQGLLREVLA